jgi:hypothetical protein
MTFQQRRLVSYLEWVDDEDFTEPELGFLRGLAADLAAPLSGPEDRSLRRLYDQRSY